MKVLIVTQYFWPETFRINEICEGLTERGHEIDVLTGKPNYPEGRYYSGYRGWGCQRETRFGANIFRVPLISHGKKSGIRLSLNYLSFIISGVLFAPWELRKRNYDLIFFVSPMPQAIPALFLGWLKKCPVVIWVQDLWPESLEATGYLRNKRLLAWVGKLIRYIYLHTDLILIQCRAFESHVAELAPGKPIEYYPNSVGGIFSLPSKDPLPVIPGLEEGFSIMFAGNIGKGQAVEVIVEAASLLKDYPDIRFVILGHGSQREWMQQQAREKGLSNIYLPGRYPMETMPGLMQKASVLLVSLADQPIFAATVPNKVQAYMAAGRPILASLNGEGARLVMESNTGLAVPAEDAKALADAVLHLYNMADEDREKMGANGRQYYNDHFDHNQLVDQLIEHFRLVAQSA